MSFLVHEICFCTREMTFLVREIFFRTHEIFFRTHEISFRTHEISFRAHEMSFLTRKMSFLVHEIFFLMHAISPVTREIAVKPLCYSSPDSSRDAKITRRSLCVLCALCGESVLSRGRHEGGPVHYREEGEHRGFAATSLLAALPRCVSVVNGRSPQAPPAAARHRWRKGREGET